MYKTLKVVTLLIMMATACGTQPGNVSTDASVDTAVEATDSPVTTTSSTAPSSSTKPDVPGSTPIPIQPPDPPPVTIPPHRTDWPVLSPGKSLVGETFLTYRRQGGRPSATPPVGALPLPAGTAVVEEVLIDLGTRYVVVVAPVDDEVIENTLIDRSVRLLLTRHEKDGSQKKTVVGELMEVNIPAQSVPAQRATFGEPCNYRGKLDRNLVVFGALTVDATQASFRPTVAVTVNDSRFVDVDLTQVSCTARMLPG